MYRVVITPWAPAASAVRMIVPRLPGSCSSSAMTSRSGLLPKRSSSSTYGRLTSAATPCGVLVSAIDSITCFETRAPRHCTRRSDSSNAAPRSLDSSSAVKATLSKCAPVLIASSIKRTPSRNTCCRSPIARTRRKRLTSGFWRLVIFSTSIGQSILQRRLEHLLPIDVIVDRNDDRRRGSPAICDRRPLTVSRDGLSGVQLDKRPREAILSFDYVLANSTAAVRRVRPQPIEERMEPTKTSTQVRVVVATSVMLSFISFWRAAAIVLNDLGSSAFYAGGLAEQYIGKAAPWFILGVMLFSSAVRLVYVESSAMFTRGGVYRVVKEAMGGTMAKLSVSALIFDFILTGPISGVTAGKYIVGLVASTITYFGYPWSPSDDASNHLAAVVAILATLYFWWRNLKGVHESSDDAMRIMYVTTVMVVMLIAWACLTLLVRGGQLASGPDPVEPQFLGRV